MNAGRATTGPVLVTGGTGKTGRRVVELLRARDVPVRVGSRGAHPPFDWEQPATWAPALQGTSAAYINYYPDVAAPGATAAVATLAETALAVGTRRLVLLSGRGEEEAQIAEQALADSGADWTVLRANWFSQNFSEGYFVESVLAGELALPAGDVGEPFVDVDDIAEVAAAVLTEDGHVGQTYELSGPRALTFTEAVAVIADTTGRDIVFKRISPADFAAGLAAVDVPTDLIDLLLYLFETVLDGRNERPQDGIERVLGRPPHDFADFVRDAAAQGVWRAGVPA
jgi:uncharacterized protein YbjT (DUF2867 family)